jgi:hypothetical protein
MTLTPALLYVFDKHMDKHDVMDQQIWLALSRSHRIDKIFEEHQDSVVLPTAAATEMKAAVLEYLKLQAALQKHCVRNLQTKLFNMTKKAHDLWHVSLLASDLNPRKVWCLPQEDLMGKVSQLLHSCMTGSSVHHSLSEFMKKYKLALHFEFANCAGRIVKD